MLLHCATCGAEINRSESLLRRNKSKKSFCNRDCRIKYQGIIEKDRFFQSIEVAGTCWIWKGRINQDGYGLFFSCGAVEMAHRAAWRLINGTIPDGINVCHDCPTGDNPACVNPAHLFLGTQLENVRDSVKKGRFTRGERAASHKLTGSIVTKIRQSIKSGETRARLASRYGVSVITIRSIVLHKTWKHVS